MHGHSGVAVVIRMECRPRIWNAEEWVNSFRTALAATTQMQEKKLAADYATEAQKNLLTRINN